MAKQTRAQRRARRSEEQRNGGEAQPVQRASQVRAAAPPTAAERHVPGSGVRRFVGEAAAELKKVEWPTQQQLIQGVTVVLIACVIVGAFLWVSDLAFKRLVENVFLGQ